MKRIKLISVAIVCFIISLSLFSCSDSYNGNVKHDAQIVCDKLEEGEMTIEEIMNEYVEQGWGMEKTSNVFNEATNLFSKKNQ